VLTDAHGGNALSGDALIARCAHFVFRGQVDSELDHLEASAAFGESRAVNSIGTHHLV
jgi:hypothetical protein